jgi:hypothetical protein
LVQGLIAVSTGLRKKGQQQQELYAKVSAYFKKVGPVLLKDNNLLQMVAFR